MSKIFKSTVVYTIGNILPQVVGFMLLPIYTEYLSPEHYGIVSSMQVLSTFFVLVFTLSIDKSIYRLYFDYKTESDKRDYFGTIAIALLCISLMSLVLIFLFRKYIQQLYTSIEFYPYFLYSILAAFFSVFSILPRIYFQINLKPVSFIVLSLTQFGISTSFILWFVVFKQQGAFGMLKGNMLANLIMMPVLVYVTAKIINFKFRREIFKESLFYSLPMIPGFLAAWFFNQSDRVFIVRYVGLSEVGLYSLAYKISSLGVAISGAFNSAYSPVFYRLANSENQNGVKEILARYNSRYIIFLMSISFCLIVFSKELIVFLADSDFREAYHFLPIITIGLLFSQAQGILNLMIYQEKKSKQMVAIGVLGGVINVLLNIALIQKYGVYGAAYSTLLTFVIMFYSAYWYARRCYFVPFEWNVILKFTLYLVIIFFCFFCLSCYVNFYIQFVIKILFILGTCSYFLFKNFNQVKSLF